jgi:hypothetical protein
MNREIRFEDIEPLLADRRIDGSSVECVFQCPSSGARFEARSHIRSDNSLASRARQSIFRNIVRSLSRGLGRMIRSVFGNNYLVRRLVGDVANDALYGATRSSGLKYSDDEIESAVVDAFGRVQQNFYWDQGAGRWIAQGGGQGGGGHHM